MNINLKDIKGITTNSKQIKTDYLFVAQQGEIFNGNNFIYEAIHLGANSILTTDSTIYKNLSQQNIYTKNGKKLKIYCTKNLNILLPNILTQYYDLHDINIWAVTGTNGKTSVAYYCCELLHLLGEKVASIGTLGIIIWNKNSKKDIFLDDKNQLTTPDICKLYRSCHFLKTICVKYIVIEVSSHAIIQNRIAQIPINLGILTNLARDHLDFHHTIANYWKAKIKLFSKFLQPNSIAIINANIPKSISNKIASLHKIHTYQVDIKGKKASIESTLIGNINKKDNTLIFYYSPTKSSYQQPINPPLSTKFMFENLLCSILSINSVTKYKMEQILDKIKYLQSPKGRMEAVYTGKNRKIYIDFAHTPDSLNKVIAETKQSNTKGRLIVLFGCGGNRDQGKREAMGYTAANLADIAIITDDNPRNELPSKIRAQIILGCMKAKKENFLEIFPRKKAIIHAINLMNKADTLIIAGKGAENYQIIKNKKLPFDERSIILDHIKKISW